MQPTQDFSADNLLWMRGRKVTEALRRKSPSTRDEWRALAENAEQAIASGSFRFSGLFISAIMGKEILSTSSTTDAIVLRKINDNIRRAYGIRQTHRSQAIKLLKKALAEKTPKGVVTADLKSCFESITPEKVIGKLKRDGRVSHQTIVLLEQFFSQSRSFGSNRYTNGLPRGVLISSTLAELFLKELDARLQEIEGVYVYLRYVDDIAMLSASQSPILFERMKEQIHKLGLKVNHSKCRNRDAACNCAFGCSHGASNCPCKNKCSCTNKKDGFLSIDYLGYKLVFPTGSRMSKSPRTYALIADSKSRKIKTRVSQAITAYKADRDFDLLLDRIKFLTKNVIVDRTLKKMRLRSGIAFTYDQYEEPPDSHPFERATLRSIDKFIRTKLRKLSASTGFTYMQKRSLMRNSVESGHGRFHRMSFDVKRFVQIRRCWNEKSKK